MTVAQLCKEVVSPTIPCGRRGLAACVVLARAHLPEVESALDGNRRQAIAEGAVSQLAKGVAAPAVGPIGNRLTTRVEEPRRHAVEVQPAGHCARPTAPEIFAKAKLSFLPLPPAVGPVCGGHGAGVVPSRVHESVLVRAHHRNGSRPGGHSGAVAELTMVVVTPAVNSVRPSHAAGVRPSRAHSAELMAANDQHWAQPRR